MGDNNGVRRAAALPLLGLTVVVLAACGTAGAGSSVSGATGGSPTVAAVTGQPAPSGTGALEAVSCGSATHCWAVGRSATNSLAGLPAAASAPASVVMAATADGGLHWRAATVPVPDPTDLAAVDCPTATACMAVGAADVHGPLNGAVLVTVNGGRTWSMGTAPAAAVGLAAVHCAGPATCMVIATDGTSYWSATTTDGGQVWQRGGSLPLGFAGAGAMACTGPTACVVAGFTATAPGKGSGAVAYTDNGGATWAAATVPPGTGLLHGVSCPSATSCLAVGTTSTTTTDVAQAKGTALTSTDGGHTWSALAAPPGIDDAVSVSCPRTGTCVSVGTVWTPTNPPTPIGGVEATRDGGATWQPPEARYIPSGLTGVDCPTVTACVAAGNNVVARVTLPAPARTRA